MIYIEPKDLWEKFQTNLSVLDGHYITCADDDGDLTICMTADASGELVLMIFSSESGDDYYESFADEESAVHAYRDMLTGFPDPPESPADEPEEDPDDFMEPILAATYAFAGVLIGSAPDKLIREDLEDIAYQMAWYMKGRYDIESLLA